ncbi:MarR family transcriptional regulator [Actinocrispum sp. NPDC049592]|uniref:MarR family winged helix-turn-helix transcriptional regulator n=1 Tax=Actinocrispum sp. NPDC049592 TaxID=3154835 RepID=UPI003438D58D
MSESTSEARRLRTLPTRLLSLAATYADRRVNEALGGVGARKWHYAVLATLDEFGSASQAELSDRTRIYRSDLVAVINELTERRFVERSPDPADRRRNVVSMTAAGRHHLGQLDRLLTEVQDDVLAPLTSQDREQLTRLLAALVREH